MLSLDYLLSLNMNKRKHCVHKRLRKSNIHRHFGSHSLFTQNRHNVIHLAELVILFSNLRGEDVTSKQALSIFQYQNEPRFDLSKDMRDVPDEEVIVLYFHLFDDMYFFGSLAPRCDIILAPEEAKDLGYNGKHESYKMWNIKRNNFICIRPYRRKRSEITLYRRETETPFRWQRLHMYLGTLLHEMTHAFFMLWACKHKDCGAGTWEKMGLYGHGCLWQDIALALEMAVKEYPICLDLTLTREIALARELRLTGRAVAREGVERWNMDYDILQQILDWKRKRFVTGFVEIPTRS
ncbi:uncharacterized protein BP5553_00255 [Venustampulla echinocandica]|uniref:SprT-like domain-containing protein n=1 Tax=Venustampulla echinocandica TaxID=2656787 RepID=A0A370TXL9_9HELO|nr:uncharacterized protein BP5553_00255 [Venustampulla echinocandica]RDL40276.1 hypothetical protein BP5553_00255 [Venustampulla echinocandica]